MKVQTITKTWAYGGGYAAKSQVTGEIMGKIVGLTVIVSSVTGTPSAAVTFRDADSCIIIPDAVCATCATGNNIYFSESHKSTLDANFNPVAVMGLVTVSITPSAAPAGAGETLTVKVRILIED
uniref:Uncharacterized protein n=1 Tax=viral metagenome TaxID=1070528 RepID=A0A6M3KC33_9ZZZZ